MSVVFGGVGLLLVIVCLLVCKINYEQNVTQTITTQKNENNVLNLSLHAEHKVQRTSPEVYLNNLVLAFQTAGSMSTYVSGKFKNSVSM